MQLDQLPEATQKFIRERAALSGLTPEEVISHFSDLLHSRGVSKHSCIFTGTPGEVFSCPCGCLNTRKVWATAKSIRADIADIPEHVLAEFAVSHPADVRKYGPGRNSTLVFRTAAVLDYIENIKEVK